MSTAHDHASDHASKPSVSERSGAVARARTLNRISLGWNAVEAVVALAAGVAAGSISLIGFGLDSVIEVSASAVLAWRLSKEGRLDCTQEADKRATRVIALSFAALAIYVGIEATRDLIAANRPEASWVGIVLAAVSLAAMPALARAKRRIAPVLGSRAQHAEANQTALCAMLSGMVLVGLGANALLDWWWADGVAALGVAVLAAREAAVTWRAESLADTCCA